MRKLVIVGTGGTSIDILDAALEALAAGRSDLEPVALLDDNPSRIGTTLQGVRVRGPLESAREMTDCWFINGIGSPLNFWRRAQIVERLGVPADRFATVVHPTASVSRWAALGAGTALLQHVTVNANARVGSHVVVLPGSIISHDCVVGDHSCLTSGVCLSGNVTIEASCYLGANCTVRNAVTVGQGSLVGMGTVLLGDVPPGSVYVGNPGRLLRSVNRS